MIVMTAGSKRSLRDRGYGESTGDAAPESNRRPSMSVDASARVTQVYRDEWARIVGGLTGAVKG